METIEGGRIKIVGCAPQSETAMECLSHKQRIEESCKVSKYYQNIIYPDTTEFTRKEFTENTIFIGCLSIENAPKARIVETVNLNGIYHSYRRRSRPNSNVFSFTEPTPRITNRRISSPVICFKFDEKPYKRAFFYKNEKTLVVGTILRNMYYGIEYLSLIMDWLKQQNLIEYHEEIIQTEESDVQVNYKKMIEFHGGQRIYVNVPIERKVCTVGCDPEFEVTATHGDGVRVIDPPHGRYNGTSPNKEIGLDGQGRQVEIRPKAFENPADTVSYMIGIMKRIQGDSFSTIGDVWPLGGHIHIGCVPYYNPPQDLKWLLDYFIGNPTINLSGRARSSYRAMAYTNSRGVETKPWGFEYRTPPAAIFRTPEFARLAMKICKNVVEAYINCQTIIVNESPSFEDYWNYAGLTPREYERWVSSLQDYRTLMESGEKYRENTVDVWTSENAMEMFPSQINREKIERWEAENADRLRVQNEARIERERRENERREAEEAERSNPRRINFADEWSSQVRETFRTEIRRELSETEFPVIHLNLFGLGAYRGMVTWRYNVEGAEEITEAGNETWIERYGVPYEIRMGANQELAERHANAIARAYRNHVIEEIFTAHSQMFDEE